MVQVDKKNRALTITFEGDTEDLTQMQDALIDLMKCYNFKDFGEGSGSTFFFALNLLKAMLPDDKQQIKGLNETK